MTMLLNIIANPSVIGEVTCLAALMAPKHSFEEETWHFFLQAANSLMLVVFTV
jgi:hypothetical protein